MAPIKTIDPELEIIESKDQLDFVDATGNFLSCVDDINEGTIKSCNQLEKQYVSLEVSQEMYLATADTNKIELTHRRDDNKGVTTFDQRTNESDYCVVQDANNAMVFHIHFMTSDQNVTRLRHQSSVVYYGPELKPCSILLTDYFRKPDPFDKKEFLVERSEWISEKTKSKCLPQKMYLEVSDTSGFSLTNGSDGSSAGIAANKEENVKRDQSMDGLPETFAMDTFNNWQQLFPLWSDYDQYSHESYEVFQDSNNSLLFHVRPKTTDSHTISGAKTIRRLHQYSISYCGPELKSCSIPLIDYRLRRPNPNPLENMAFFMEKPKRPKRRSKKSKSHRL
ncbi:hypothetical protein HA402_003094 [Bradysia odoriphaga]|nr:hypothetical protein HA402_003094 [Bradysia odoriphaga]